MSVLDVSTMTTSKSARITSLLQEKSFIEGLFKRTSQKVLTPQELRSVLARKRRNWGLDSVPKETIIEFLLAETPLRFVTLESKKYGSEERYAWGDPSRFEIALSLRPGSYLSHGTAAYLNGLLEVPPSTVHVNKEQSPKRQRGSLTQEGLDRAFHSRPRQSAMAYTDEHGGRYVVVAGKNTRNFGVVVRKGPMGERLRVTRLERTLVDIAVRPVYSGGAAEVLRAYQAARDQLSIPRLVNSLRRLRHLYPYHQAIGFYLDRAGYTAQALEPFRQPGLSYDFYLTHGMGERAYSRDWRLYYPRDL
jgi:predicted transcriptional regulator of viral defense system